MTQQEYNQTYWGGSDNVMSMRWENKELLQQLWLNLAYLSPVEDADGNIQMRKVMRGKAPINYEGAKSIINVIQSVVNPVGSLSKISEAQALILLKHIKQSVRRTLATKTVEYECTDRADMQQVLSIVENICLLQLMRAVNGHESQQSRTNLMERREEGSYHQSMKGGSGGIFDWGGKK